jgi:hypothetical protein
MNNQHFGIIPIPTIEILKFYIRTWEFYARKL